MNRGHRNCEICGIQEKQCRGKVFFAKFPSRDHICKQWVKSVGKEDLVYLPIEKLHDLRYVCGRHFEEHYFTKTKTRLTKNAVPTLQLTQPPLPDELLEGFPLHKARQNQESDNIILHLFPNPVNEFERFHTWCYAIGGEILTLENDTIFKKSRVCHSHFEAKYYTSSKRLSAISVPTLLLPGTKQTIRNIVENDHSYCCERYTRTYMLSKVAKVGANSNVKTTVKLEDTDHKSKKSKCVETESIANPAEGRAEQDQVSPDQKALHSGETEIFSWQKENSIEILTNTDAPVPDDGAPTEPEPSLYQDQEAPRTEQVPAEDHIYRCNECGGKINGFRYTCVQCVEFDLCGACEARGAHNAHYVLRVPGPRPHEEVQSLLETIRLQLLHGNVFVQFENDGMKVEVKEEPGEAPADPLASVDDQRDCIEEEIAEETESIADHHLPRKRPRNQYPSAQKVTHATSTIDHDKPNPQLKARVHRLHDIEQTNILDDDPTPEVMKSHHSLDKTNNILTNKNVPSNNQQITINHPLDKRKVPVIDLTRKNTWTKLVIPPGINAKDFVRRLSTKRAIVRVTDLKDRQLTTK